MGSIRRVCGRFVRLLWVTALLVATLAMPSSAQGDRQGGAARIDMYDCYGSFCLRLEGICVNVQRPLERRQIVSNVRVEATFYDEQGDLEWTDVSFVNMHFMVSEDGTHTYISSQVYFDVATWENGDKFCFAYAAVVRDNELIVQNVTREDCGPPA